MAITIIATRRIAIINSHNDSFSIDNVLNFFLHKSGENYTLYFLLLMSFEKKDRQKMSL